VDSAVAQKVYRHSLQRFGLFFYLSNPLSLLLNMRIQLDKCYPDVSQCILLVQFISISFSFFLILLLKIIQFIVLSISQYMNIPGLTNVDLLITSRDHHLEYENDYY
jgi:hypothetical protein